MWKIFRHVPICIANFLTLYFLLYLWCKKVQEAVTVYKVKRHGIKHLFHVSCWPITNERDLYLGRNEWVYKTLGIGRHKIPNDW